MRSGRIDTRSPAMRRGPRALRGFEELRRATRRDRRRARPGGDRRTRRCPSSARNDLRPVPSHASRPSRMRTSWTYASGGWPYGIIAAQHSGAVDQERRGRVVEEPFPELRRGAQPVVAPHGLELGGRARSRRGTSGSGSQGTRACGTTSSWSGSTVT
jgi:hypothetical protein